MIESDMFVVGDPLPRIVSITTLDNFDVTVTWEAGTHRPEQEIVDLAPSILAFKVYAPLRNDPALFRTVSVQDHGYGIVWGDGGAIDMASTMVEHLAGETMAAEDFAAFMKRHGFTLDRVAAELGISRRMAAYYRKARKVPRYIALACAYVDSKMAQPEVSDA